MTLTVLQTRTSLWHHRRHQHRLESVAEDHSCCNDNVNSHAMLQFPIDGRTVAVAVALACSLIPRTQAKPRWKATAHSNASSSSFCSLSPLCLLFVRLTSLLNPLMYCWCSRSRC